MMNNRLGFLLLAISGSITLFAAPGLAQTEGGGSGVAKTVRIAEASTASQTFKRAISAKVISAAIVRAKSPNRKPAGVSTEFRSNRKAAAPADPAVAVGSMPTTTFVSDRQTDYGERIADMMGLSGQEKEAAITIFNATKEAFEKEVAAKGRDNNLSAALVFFIAATVTVYHNDPEPSDSELDSLWDGLEETLRRSPEIAKLGDAEKEEIYNALVFTSGLVLAFREMAKENRDPDLASQSRSVAGTLISQTLNVNPEKLRFTRKGLVLSP